MTREASGEKHMMKDCPYRGNAQSPHSPRASQDWQTGHTNEYETTNKDTQKLPAFLKGVEEIHSALLVLSISEDGKFYKGMNKYHVISLSSIRSIS